MTIRAWRRVAAVTVSALVVLGAQAPVVASADTSIGSVTVAGDLDSELGCASDWLPSCAATHLTLGANGFWTGTFDVPPGSYSYKVALDDNWSVSYGDNGGSGNISLNLGGTTPTPVTFFFDPVTHQVGDSVNEVVAVGSFQTQLGCAANGSATCVQSWMRQTTPTSRVYTLTTGVLAPGATYTVSAATLFGAGPVHPSTPVSFTVAGAGATVTMTYTAATQALTVSQVALVGGPPRVFSHPTAPRKNVVANLFEWNWKSVANECVTVLGPAGYGAVQVAPPEDSINDETSNPDTVHPWWEVYQPVDYNLTSRMGNEAQFKQMVATCRAQGVKVYVDTVINHMTGQGSTSYGGESGFTKYNYPGLYTQADFHNYPQDCPRADDTINDFNNVTQVQKCELVGLSDLRTESDSVRSKIAGYMNKLMAYGVSGFRIDAAKHIGQADLSGIEAKLTKTLDGTAPYIALEVPPGGPGSLSPFAFQQQGSLLGFDFAYAIKAAFTSNITDLSVFGENSGLLPSTKSLAFVENHDSERDGSTLSYKAGATNTLATEFMLAYGYGVPEVYAGFAFATHDQGPPSLATGMVTDTNCDNGWACVDRTKGVANLVDFHNYVYGAPVTNFWGDGTNLIAFSRGAKGWIAINNEATPQTHTFTTGLPAGTYCDIIHGTFSVSRGSTSCSGKTVTVDSAGQAKVTVPAMDSVAFDAGDLVRN